MGRNWLIRLKSWEYWPFGIVQFPAILYYLGLVARTRSVTFFSASNPAIPMGGMFGESKFAVLELVPDSLKPKGILISRPCSFQEAISQMETAGISFPVVFKPDIGERGYQVKRIYSLEEAERYHLKMPFDYIIQELVSEPLEFGVYYARIPGSQQGKVVSIVEKEFLSVSGDGRSTLQELILANDRAKLQWETLQRSFSKKLAEVLPDGQTMVLVDIGNHCLGTKFLNGNHLIDDEMHRSFDYISQKIPGFYFGRFDLRCKSMDDLRSGRVKILELNGCGAEPAHIYHPGYPLWKGMVDLVKHWHLIYTISRKNYLAGIPYVQWNDALRYYRKFKERTSLT